MNYLQRIQILFAGLIVGTPTQRAAHSMNDSNRTSTSCWGKWCAILAGISLFPVCGALGQQLTQTITLKPGWNAVWLEVDPTNRNPTVVFAGLPLLSVWTWSERVTATDFIQNPATAGWNKSKWLGWFPPESPEAALGNLFSIIPSRAYLLHVGGASPVSWAVTGSVIPQPTTWSPNQYNLRGLPVDPASPPTFREFFRHSLAHWDTGNDATTPIYRLNTNGVWSAVTPENTLRRNEAYWIFTSGASDYGAPEGLTASTGDRVYFSPLVIRASLTLANRTAEPRTLTFKSLMPTSPATLGIKVENPFVADPNQSRTFLHLHSETLQPGQQRRLTIYLDRTQSPSGSNGTLFTVSDQEGTLHYLSIASDGGGQPDATEDKSFALGGLWLGAVTLNAVGEAHATNSLAPTPVQSPFSMRLLVFVDTNGAASLLREATLVTLPNTYTNAVGTNTTGGLVTNLITIPGLPVLLSDPALVSQYQSRYQYTAAAVRRFTAAQFDNSNPTGVPLVGSFVTNGSVTCTLNLPFDHPTNPYYHRYHPDHDNLDATYKMTVPEAYSLTRKVELNFTPIGSGVPSYGVDGLDGIYQETVSGLHKVPLLTSGTFTLQRISIVNVLNPQLP